MIIKSREITLSELTGKYFRLGYLWFCPCTLTLSSEVAWCIRWFCLYQYYPREDLWRRLRSASCKSYNWHDLWDWCCSLLNKDLILYSDYYWSILLCVSCWTHHFPNTISFLMIAIDTATLSQDVLDPERLRKSGNDEERINANYLMCWFWNYQVADPMENSVKMKKKPSVRRITLKYSLPAIYSKEQYVTRNAACMFLPEEKLMRRTLSFK
jgi:hypothetical protein